MISSAKIGLIENRSLNTKLIAFPAALDAYKQFTNDAGMRQAIGEYVLNYYPFKETGKITGLDSGDSNFSYNQKELLSQSRLESYVDLKRVNTVVALRVINDLSVLQNSILDLIEAELAQRRVIGTTN
jgi:hypothetical protein